jgi:putative DNA primase/helicase
LTMDELLVRLNDKTGYLPKSIPTGYLAVCPAHDDRSPSLSLSEAPDRLLIFCHANCSAADIVSALDLELKDLYLNGDSPGAVKFVKQEPEAEFIYTDERNKELYRVTRYPGKQFRHKFRRVPYRLNDVLFAREIGRSIYICEGEKDVEALRTAGKTATCNSGGAGNWLPEFSKYFVGARVIIVADNDAPGLEHAKEVAALLYQVAKSIHVVLSRSGKDAADHLEAGLAPEEFYVYQEVK